ncbi:MAG TPA: oxalurate catabolism protein HpxZ [Alphaproteobacteria bacterium]|nr:oxalurate catabolism protein HpxZ [Alphaproteobacteria bacterium]
MEINKPAVVAEVTAAFEAYENALMANDVDALVGDFFWDDPRVLRYSMGVNSYGPDEIRTARTRIPSADRTLEKTIIATFGDDFATANTEFTRTATGKRGRQSQTWVRLPEVGWRVVAAHVSWYEPA